MTTTLITGGAGFIGSHLARRFLKEGHTVRIIDDFSSGRRVNIEEILGDIELIEGDIRNPEDCAKACEGATFVYHQAARPSVPRSIVDPVTSHEVNINGTFNLLLAARDAGVKRVVYAASSSAYGDSPEPIKHEGLPNLPKSPYAVQKLTAEHYLKAFSECYGLQTIGLRYFNVFGPHQDPKSQYAAAIPAFVTRIMSGTPPTIHGDGEQTRDFTFIDNVVHGNFLASQVEETSGQVMNLACGGSYSVNQVIALINEILGTDVPSEHVADRAGDIKHSNASIEMARGFLGYEPVVTFEDGLRLAIDWYRENY